MPRFKFAVLTLLYFFLFLVVADDMVLEVDDGLSVLLHDDHTWHYAADISRRLEQNTTVLLENGESVYIKTNGTWDIVQGDTRSLLSGAAELGEAYSKGTAQGADQFVANMKAMDMAIKHLAKQIGKATNKKNITIDRLHFCIEEGDKDIESSEKLSGNIWRVQVKLTVGQEQINAILDCAQDE